MHIYPAKKKETNLATNLEKQDTVVSNEYLHYSSVCNTTKRKFYGVLSHDDILRHFGSLFTQVSDTINQTKGTAGAPC